jgi:flagellar motor switch protein FliN/FliY
MSLASDHWIRKIETLVAGETTIPMWGAIPAFPWKAFAKELSTALEMKPLKISAGAAEWKEESSLLNGMGHSPLQIAIELSPLKGNFSLVFPSEDFAKISSWAIHPDAKNSGFSDPYLQKGFFRFLCAEGIEALERLQSFPGLAPKLIDMPLEQDDAYCIDIAIEHSGETVWGRMICPVSFQEAVKHHFVQDWNFSLRSNLYESLMPTLSLTAGKTTLSQENWKKLEKGDFVILDHCSYYPHLKKGTFQLQCASTPLFQVKVKEDAIKILDYAYYFEEKRMDEDHFEESFETSGEEAVSIEDIPVDSLLSPKKVPISLTVEVARMKMSLDKLLKLKPGNVLQLGVQVEKGVSLIANGECVGKGELVQIGDVIGVKIIKLGE